MRATAAVAARASTSRCCRSASSLSFAASSSRSQASAQASASTRHRARSSAIPLEGGISLDLTRMSSIVALAADDLAVTVQAGVTRSQVEAAAGPHGLWFPVDPGADATLGGMAATNASGTTTVRYGGMRAHV